MNHPSQREEIHFLTKILPRPVLILESDELRSSLRSFIEHISYDFEPSQGSLITKGEVIKVKIADAILKELGIPTSHQWRKS